jgi:hypothetical protein
LFQICGTAVDETAPPLVGGLDSILLCWLHLELLHMTDMMKKRKEKEKGKRKGVKEDDRVQLILYI